MSHSGDGAVPSLAERIEAYLDAAPRSAATAEEVGRFTLFRPLGPWPFYARPRLGLVEQITPRDIDQLAARQRELNLPRNIEWIHETTPSLTDAARVRGLFVHDYPLMTLDRADYMAPPLEAGLLIRYIDSTDRDFARVQAVAAVGFGAGGTAVGPEGALQRDAAALARSEAATDFVRERVLKRVSIIAAIVDDDGPLAVGTHQPVGRVTEIVGVATLPSARRRGLGAAVTAALVEDAWSRGVDTIFLSAGSADVARIYARIGFRQIGSARSVEQPADASAPDDEGVDIDA